MVSGLKTITERAGRQQIHNLIRLQRVFLEAVFEVNYKVTQ